MPTDPANDKRFGPKPGGKRPGSGRKAKQRLLLLDRLIELDYDPVQNLINDAEAARQREDFKLATQIDLDLITYLVPKPRTDIGVKGEVTISPLVELAKQLGERPKPKSEDE